MFNFIKSTQQLVIYNKGCVDNSLYSRPTHGKPNVIKTAFDKLFLMTNDTELSQMYEEEFE